MSRDVEYGPMRFAMICEICGESTAYPTQAIADDKLELHHAFVHTAAGRQPRLPPDPGDDR
jgi:hypothetical protein